MKKGMLLLLVFVVSMVVFISGLQNVTEAAYGYSTKDCNSVFPGLCELGSCSIDLGNFYANPFTCELKCAIDGRLTKYYFYRCLGMAEVKQVRQWVDQFWDFLSRIIK